MRTFGFFTLVIALFWSPWSEATYCSQRYTPSDLNYSFCKVIDSLTIENCKKVSTPFINLDPIPRNPLPGYSRAKTPEEIFELFRKTACEFLPLDSLDRCSEQRAGLYDFCKFINFGYTTHQCSDLKELTRLARYYTDFIQKQHGFTRSPLSQFMLPSKLCQFGFLLHKRKLELQETKATQIISNENLNQCSAPLHVTDPILPSIKTLHHHTIEIESKIDSESIIDSTNTFPSLNSTTESKDKILKKVLLPFFNPEIFDSQMMKSLQNLAQYLNDQQENQIEYSKRKNSSISSTFLLPHKIRLDVITTPEGRIYLHFPDKTLGNGTYKIASLCVDYKEALNGNSHSALALLRQKKPDDSDIQEEIEEEMKLQSKIQEQMESAKAPPVAQIKDTLKFKLFKNGQTNTFYIMERFDSDLYDFTEKDENTRYVMNNSLNFAIQLAKQVKALHLNEFTHNDIKPENVLIQPDKGRVTLADFGYSLDLKHIPNDNLVLGTPYYVSPELVIRHRETHRYTSPIYHMTSDIFALGLTFYFMKYMHTGCHVPGLAPQKYFSHISAYQHYSELCQICNIYCDPLDDTKTRPPTKGTFDFLIYRMLNPNPDNRPSIVEVLEKLKHLQSE